MVFPVMIYKEGKASDSPENYLVVNSPKEVLVAMKQGFWKSGLEKPEDMLQIPEIAKYLDDEKKRIAEERDNDEFIRLAIDEKDSAGPAPTLEEAEYEKKTGKKAICDRGPYKGKETKSFKNWKKERKELQNA